MEAKKIRPHSVPVWLTADSTQRVHLPPRTSGVFHDSLVSTSTQRPRAPILKPEKTRSILPKRRRQGRKASKKYQPTQSLDESHASLAAFGKNNRGREVNPTSAATGDIHYVNIEPSFKNSEDSSFFEKRESILKNKKVVSIPSTQFQIPELPTGKRLTLNILSTWGDPFYVGLMGIEIFDQNGRAIQLSDPDEQLSADPSDLNAYNDNDDVCSDPRSIDKIMDGTFHTCDEMHSWLAPYTSGENHYIYISLDSNSTLSMLRLWNCNTSRTHSSRGIRYVEMMLDNILIFKGEIKRASGTANDVDANSECILFSTNESVLALIAKYDKHYQEETNIDQLAWMKTEEPLRRPKTGDRSQMQKLDFALTPSVNAIEPSLKKENVPLDFRPRTAPSRTTSPVMGQILSFFILDNWGDSDHVGLTGIEILDTSFHPIVLETKGLSSRGSINSSKMDSAHVLLETTTSSTWSIAKELCGIEEPVLVLDMQTPRIISALKIWNYNSNLEDSFRGVKRIVILLDGRLISPPMGFLIRKAPGTTTSFDYGQFLHFNGKDTLTSLSHDEEEKPPATADVSSRMERVSLHESPVSFPKQHARGRALLSIPSKIFEEEQVSQQYQTPLFPSGCIIKFVLNSTWGDCHYLGLNGIQLYDEHNSLYPIQDDQFEATPRDVNILEGGPGTDVRTPDKLFNGSNNTYDDRNMWLSPYSPNGPENVIMIVLDEPITLSKILLWNYSKTPSRGVCDYKVYMDDVLIYRGILKAAPERDESVIINTTADSSSRKSRTIPEMAQALLFTNDAHVIETHRHLIYLHENEECVTFIDNNNILQNNTSELIPDRPGTSAGRSNSTVE